MKAARLDGYGQREVPLVDMPMPVPAPGEVLVRVHAAALNPLDVKLRAGTLHGFFPLAFPYLPGTDLAGVVESPAASGSPWRAGDRVVARLDPVRGGALAEFASVPADQLVRAPATLPFADAAGLPTAAATAWQALFETAGLARGQSVLVHAGAGGVGTFAIQLARRAGARVIATASGDGLELARELGADVVIDWREEDFRTRVSDLDVVLDTVGGETQARSFEVLRPGGVLAALTAEPDAALARAHRVRAGWVFHQSDGARLAAVVEAVDAGRLRVAVDRRGPPATLAAAFDRQASGRARGKILVDLV